MFLAGSFASILLARTDTDTFRPRSYSLANSGVFKSSKALHSACYDPGTILGALRT